MKMIDVLNKLAKGKIKEGTKLKMGYKIYDYINDYTGSDDCSFVNQEDVGDIFLEDDELITKSFLNYEVELIPPKPKKYYLRLDKDDNFSYINKNVYFSYEVANKSEHTNYKTKFTQEEIDESMLLKFIEQHGIKEVVDEDENH